MQLTLQVVAPESRSNSDWTTRSSAVASWAKSTLRRYSTRALLDVSFEREGLVYASLDTVLVEGVGRISGSRLSGSAAWSLTAWQFARAGLEWRAGLARCRRWRRLSRSFRWRRREGSSIPIRPGRRRRRDVRRLPPALHESREPGFGPSSFAFRRRRRELGLACCRIR